MAQRTLTVQSITITSGGQTLGAIQSINPQHSLGVTKLREINAATNGEVVEVIPGVEDISMGVNGFALRTATSNNNWLPRRLANRPANEMFSGLVALKTPFDVKINQVATDEGGNVIGSSTIVYKDCLLSSYSYNIQITGDVVVSESATIQVGKCFTE